MPEPIENQYFLLGHISRTHGVDGTVLVIPVIEAARSEFFDKIELIRLQNERGDLIPARINSVKYKEKDDRISFFVKFEHINSRNEAEAVTGSSVFVERSKVKKNLIGKHSWISFEVFNDSNESIGIVESVIQNPAHPILEISTDAGDILVPFVDEYITEVNEDKKVIYCQNMDRLTTL